ncbi:MAG TPA: hypothetical protein VJJ82_04410 [Candidatus Nanoarchaeia archaeon]|nr:hypothetical protein [Candidatus Nanoarchaeia archaeon]
MKGMSAFVTVVLSLIVILILLFGAFGPGSITKNLNKWFFGENADLIPRLDDYVVPGTIVSEGMLRTTIVSTALTKKEREAEIAKQVATELANCWRTMKTKSATSWFGEQNLKCKEICYCFNPPCACTKLTTSKIYPVGPIVSFGAIRDELKTIEIREVGQKDPLVGAADALQKNWRRENLHLARTHILGTGSINEIRDYTGIFDNILYFICADYDYPDADDLFLTDNFAFECG